MATFNSNLASDLLQKLLDSQGEIEGLVAIDFVLEESEAGMASKDSDSKGAKGEEAVPFLVFTVEDRSKVFLPNEIHIGDLYFAVRVEEGSPVKLFAADQSRLPVPPRGPITGGDAIWHPLGGWGTLALAAPIVTFINHQNTSQVVRNAVLSCNHILALLDQADTDDQLVTYRKQTDLWLDYYWPVTNNAIVPVDIAIGQSSDLAAYDPTQVRGLGAVNGVDSPTDGERLFKCGAATSITTARDAGVGAILMPFYNNRTVVLRKTTPDFADVGDSGSAVLNASRELVGFVVAGRTSAAGIITYYLPTARIDAGPSANPLLRLSLS